MVRNCSYKSQKSQKLIYRCRDLSLPVSAGWFSLLGPWLYNTAGPPSYGFRHAASQPGAHLGGVGARRLMEKLGLLQVEEKGSRASLNCRCGIEDVEAELACRQK